MYDFLAVGDVVTDVFIKLKDASVHCDINEENCQLCVDFGAKIPYESATEIRAVGNAANAAVSAHRLGLKAALVSNIGDDRVSDEILDHIEHEGMPREFLSVHRGMKANYHYVLQYEVDRTILIKHEEYPYHLPDFAEPPKWFYLSSISEHALDYQHQFAAYVKESGAKLAFQPGTFQINESEKLADLYSISDLFFCNKQEAQKILKTDEGDFVKLIEGLRARGPKVVAVTDGPKGAYAGNGSGVWFMPIYPDPAPPVSRTGAGDAFASTFTAYIAKGMSMTDALIRAPINSALVVQQVGAQTGLLKESELEEWLAKAPTDYKPQKMA